MNVRLVAIAVGAVCLGGMVGTPMAAFANPTAYSVAPMLQQRDAFADRFWGLLQAPAVATPPAGGANTLYDFREVLGRPDPFAQQFYGAGAPAPQPARPAATAPVAPAPIAAPIAQVQPAPRPAATTASGLPTQQPAPVQIVTAQPVPAAGPSRIALAAAAPAAPASRWYLTGDVGFATLGEATNTGDGVANEHAYDAGPVLAFAVGNQRTSTLSFEGEFATRRFGMSTITPSGGTPITATGTVSTLSLLGNVKWAPEFNWRFNPYLLGGAGIAQHKMADVAAAGISTVNSSDWVIAYQLGFGAEWPLSPRWSIDSSYRYFSTLAPELTDAAGRTFETAVASHNVLVGARYNF